MKRKGIILAAVAAAAGVAYYMTKKKKSGKGKGHTTAMSGPGDHHLTNVFAKAKEQSIK
jgi:hypothetical protein